jgi:hypothetical protein
MLQKRAVFVLLISIALMFFFASKPAAAQTKPQDSYILKGAPMGGVKLDHKTHSETHAAKKCETCHHPSKPEKAATAPQQACFDCHATPAKAPMKTNRQLTFHNPLAKAGTCIDCHTAENAKGKKAPVKCLDCHKKSNV